MAERSTITPADTSAFMLLLSVANIMIASTAAYSTHSFGVFSSSTRGGTAPERTTPLLVSAPSNVHITMCQLPCRGVSIVKASLTAATLGIWANRPWFYHMQASL